MSTFNEDLELKRKHPLEEVFSVNFDSTCYFCKTTISIGRVELGIDIKGEKEVRIYQAKTPHKCKFVSKKEERDN